ncbi:hypothetical protein F5X99DRAFT_389872 [Biscogniauxia marginata]|nr:hypothetical protein F5X99DRAFT_389872 [Biscogniauxia marginata]
MVCIPAGSSDGDTAISQSPGVATPSSTGTSEAQKGFDLPYDQLLLDTLLSIREEKLRELRNLTDDTQYEQAEVPNSDSTTSSHPLHQASGVPSRPSQTQQPHAENKSSSCSEDIKYRIRDWMAAGTRTDPEEALHLRNPQARKNPGDSPPRTSSGDGGRLPSLDLHNAADNCVISHDNLAALLRMIGNGKPEASSRRELEAMEQALEVQVTKTQEEKERADRLEARLQDMQALDVTIREWREEKEVFKRESEKAYQKLESLIMKPFIMSKQPSKAEKPEAEHAHVKKMRNKLHGLQAIQKTTNKELYKLRTSIEQQRTELDELTKSQRKLELDDKAVDGRLHAADDDHRIHDIDNKD